MLFRNQTKTFCEIFFQLLIDSKVIFKNIISAENTQQGDLQVWMG